VITTINKRFSDRWMVNGSLTVQTNPQYIDHQVNPTGQEYVDGRSTIARYLFKMAGSYAAPWGINVAANLNYNDGPNRTRTIDGPASAFGGLNANGQPTTLTGATYNSLEFEPRGTTRLDSTALLDLGVHKVISFRGGRNRVKVMADLFNVFNIATIRGYESNNMSETDFLAPDSIVPPRVFRIGAQISF
jgi:TonB dependent receptor